jgi:putative phosphotransacetylase
MPGGKTTVPERAASGKTVTIGISNRHIHITQQHVEKLFGPGTRLTPDRPITQPGQFAARERLRVVGPKGAVDGVRIVGPTRAATQVELSVSDCRRIGLEAPLRHSGKTAGSAPVHLEGPSGAIDLPEGAIVAARHMHVAPADAARLGVADGDRVTVVLGRGDRYTTLHDVLVRSGPTHATEIHLDSDEASAFGVATGDRATIVGRPEKRPSRVAAAPRRLLTERDIASLAARGEELCAASPYLVTPAARDRAKALGIWSDV